MSVHPQIARSRVSLCLVVISLLISAPNTASAADNPTTRPSTRPAATKPAKERDRERLLAVHAATLASLDYAKAHEQTIPTTEQLAKHMGVAAKDFQYRVVPSGSLDKHMKRVKGDWPEVPDCGETGGRKRQVGVWFRRRHVLDPEP